MICTLRVNFKLQLQSGESNEDSETINEQIEKQTRCLSDVDARIDKCKGKVS